MKRQREYFYLPLADAIKSIGVKVNLFALLDHVAPPYLTSSSDLVLKLKVVDPTYPAIGVTVIFSADSKAKFPNVKSPGDIISLHRVMMSICDGEYYSVYDKRSSSFALFEGTSENLEPYETSEKYNATDHDTVFLKQMREWSSDRMMHEVLTEHPLKMNRINPCAVFDIICKVLHVNKTSGNQLVLYVWDGTDAPPGLQITTSSSRDQHSTSPISLQLEETPLPRDTLCSFPCVGTILRVFSNKNFTETSKLRNHDRPWVQLCNITCTMHFSGIWEGSLQPFSKVRILSDQDDIVLDCIREYNSRLNKPHGRYPWMCHPLFSSITVTDHPNMGYSTLMDSLTNSKEQHLIKAIVRVVDVYPPEFSYKGQDEVRLTLEDPTGRVHAFLLGKAVEKFFGVQSSKATINSRMKTLLGVSECETEEGFIIMRDPPWSVFCLKSCLSHKGSSRIRKYLIQDTML